MQVLLLQNVPGIGSAGQIKTVNDDHARNYLIPRKLAVPAPAGAGKQTTHDVCQHPWDYWAEPFRIFGNLYYIGNRYVSSHLIDTGEGLIVLDTTFPQTLYLLLESIRRLGFNPDHIRYVLHCHAHYDHFGGTRALVALTAAQTALGKQDAEVLQTRPELSWATEYGVELHETFQVDLPLQDSETISLGRTCIECVHTPGHTAGCMSYFFEIEDDTTSYRVGIHGGPGLNTLTDEYLTQYALPASRRRDYVASLHRLQTRSVDVFIGAHPDQNDTFGKRALLRAGENRFIDREAWQEFLKTLEDNARAAFGSVE